MINGFNQSLSKNIILKLIKTIKFNRREEGIKLLNNQSYFFYKISNFMDSKINSTFDGNTKINSFKIIKNKTTFKLIV